MNIYGVYEKWTSEMDFDQFSDEESLIVAFESEDEANQYVAKHNNPRRTENGNDCGELFVRSIRVVSAGQYDSKNNYGFVNDEKEGYRPYVCPICGHATLTHYSKEQHRTEHIINDGEQVGVAFVMEFYCELCNQMVVGRERILSFDSPNVDERVELARLGYNLENYIYDESPRVRLVLAQKGLGHDVFIDNPNEHPSVLRELVQRGLYLDILKNHPDKSVSEPAKKRLRRMGVEP